MNILHEKRKTLGFHARCSDAPDMSGANAAALATAELSKEQLAWAKQIYAETAPDRAAATQRANAISDAQLASMQQSDAIAKDLYAYSTGTFRPLEEKMVADAQSFDTPARRAAERAKATAGIETQLSAQRQATIQDNMRRSVNPSSMKMQALQGTMDIQAAKLKAGASSMADEKIEQLGYARTADAASLGRNLATDRVNATNAALTAGNSSSANGQASGNITAQGANIMQTGFAGATSAMASAGSQYANIANIQGQDNGFMGALGTLGGAAISKYSDVTMKEDIAPVDEEQALAAVQETPVSSWAYKAGTMGAAEGGTDKKVGPMAQDVNASMGEQVAPGGKKIDLVSMNGVLMAAVKGLAKKVDSIAASRGLPMPA
jgi:hypothetical protein